MTGTPHLLAGPESTFPFSLGTVGGPELGREGWALEFFWRAPGTGRALICCFNWAMVSPTAVFSSGFASGAWRAAKRVTGSWARSRAASARPTLARAPELVGLRAWGVGRPFSVYRLNGDQGLAYDGIIQGP